MSFLSRILLSTMLFAVSCCASAEDWRWCSAGDLLDSGRTNGPNLVTRPFQADGAPDFQAQYEAYVRSVMGPIQGEFMLNCSPAFPDHDAAVKHNGEWQLWMHDITAGLFKAEDVYWAPAYASHSAAGGNDASAASAQRAPASVAQATSARAAPATASQGAMQEAPAQPAAASAEAQRQAEQRRQHWEQQRVGAQQGDAGAGAGGAVKPLRFVLWVPMMPRAGDAHNPACYSNVITRPGPPGWGAPGFLPTGTAEQAIQTIDGLKDAFVAKCRAASGRETAGMVHHSRNQSERDEVDLAKVQARFQEDVTVQMD